MLSNDSDDERLNFPAIHNEDMSRALFAQRNIALHGPTCCLSNNYRRLALQASLSDGPIEDEHREARTWLASFNINAIPKNACEVTFSRSSGPGGQNVNKCVT